MQSLERLKGLPDRQVDLARAALLVARIESPELDPEPWLGRLDDLARRSGVTPATDPSTALGRLRKFLFEEERFRGNADDYFDPRNSCLDQVLERRLGIPITLSVVMIEVGRRLGLVIEGVGLPGHFMVRAQCISASVLIDPFHGGSVLSVADAEDVVAQAMGQRVELTERHFAPVTKVQIVTRMLANLRSIYVQREQWPKALAVIDRLLALDPDGASHLRDRGTVRMRLGDFYRGAADWEQYLTRVPNARDADKLRSQLKRVRQTLASLN